MLETYWSSRAADSTLSHDADAAEAKLATDCTELTEVLRWTGDDGSVAGAGPRGHAATRLQARLRWPVNVGLKQIMGGASDGDTHTLLSYRQSRPLEERRWAWGPPRMPPKLANSAALTTDAPADDERARHLGRPDAGPLLPLAAAPVDVTDAPRARGRASPVISSELRLRWTRRVGRICGDGDRAGSGGCSSSAKAPAAWPCVSWHGVVGNVRVRSLRAVDVEAAASSTSKSDVAAKGSISFAPKPPSQNMPASPSERITGGESQKVAPAASWSVLASAGTLVRPHKRMAALPVESIELARLRVRPKLAPRDGNDASLALLLERATVVGGSDSNMASMFSARDAEGRHSVSLSPLTLEKALTVRRWPGDASVIWSANGVRPDDRGLGSPGAPAHCPKPEFRAADSRGVGGTVPRWRGTPAEATEAASHEPPPWPAVSSLGPNRERGIVTRPRAEVRIQSESISLASKMPQRARARPPWAVGGSH